MVHLGQGLFQELDHFLSAIDLLVGEHYLIVTPAADDAGKVTINTKSYIYPLKAKDGVMFDCHPETSHFEDLVKTLENAGFEEAEVDTVGDNVWASDYTLEGEPMRITITETDAGRLIVFIQYQPE